MGWGTVPKQAQETQTLKQGQKEKAPPLNRDDKNSNDPRVEERERKRERERFMNKIVLWKHNW
jgi:hypothetical protein